jgi:hypothetical protein
VINMTRIYEIEELLEKYKDVTVPEDKTKDDY